MKVECDVEEVELEDENGREVDGVVVTCGECGHAEQSFGTSGRSIRRCLAMLRENCPEGSENYYAADGSDD